MLKVFWSGVVALVLMKNSYTLYILQCADGSLYTGITTDMERRLAEHNGSLLGARYTSVRRPVILVYQKAYRNRSQASIEESRVKKLSRAEKLELIGSAHGRDGIVLLAWSHRSPDTDPAFWFVNK